VPDKAKPDQSVYNLIGPKLTRLDETIALQVWLTFQHDVPEVIKRTVVIRHIVQVVKACYSLACLLPLMGRNGWEA